MSHIATAKIKGNRLVVWFDMTNVEYSSTVNGKRIKFADLKEARTAAEKRGFDDGIHVKYKNGYGLKRRIKALIG